jgi:glycerophosphoryl diester phosphodiesterase
MILSAVLQLWRKLPRRLYPVWRGLLAVNGVYAVLGLVVLAPLPGILFRLMMALSGKTALSDQDIALFLLTPWGMASLVLAAGVLIAIAALTQASLMVLAVGAEGAPVAARTAVAYAFRRLLSILSLSVRLVGRVLMLAAPFLALAAATAWLALSSHDINYYLAERPPAFWIAAAIIGGLLALLAVLVVRKLLGWALALPLVLFARLAPAIAFDESERLTRGHRALVLGAYAVWAVIAAALGVLVLALIGTLGDWIVPKLSGSLTPLVVALGALVALWGLLSFLAATVNAAAFAGVTLGLADRLGVPLHVALDAAPTPRAAPSPPRLTTGRIVAALAVVAGVAAATGAWLLGGIDVHDDVLVVAHRGAAGKAPENTLASVRQAIADRADWIEIDVQETADGEVVVVHDSDFMKLAKEPMKVWDGTLEQIRRIDVGGWLDPAYAGERVPTLREVLETVRGRAKLVIELKYYGHDQQLERRVVELVEAADMADDVAIMSLKYAGVQKVRALRPDWRTGLLAAKAIGDLSRLDVDFLAVNKGLVSAHFVRHAEAAGKPVFAWTINDPASLARVVAAGVAGVITDEPEAMRGLLAEREEMGPVELLLLRTALLFDRPPPVRRYRDDSP